MCNSWHNSNEIKEIIYRLLLLVLEVPSSGAQLLSTRCRTAVEARGSFILSKMQVKGVSGVTEDKVSRWEKGIFQTAVAVLLCRGNVRQEQPYVCRVSPFVAAEKIVSESGHCWVGPSEVEGEVSVLLKECVSGAVVRWGEDMEAWSMQCVYFLSARADLVD